MNSWPIIKPRNWSNFQHYKDRAPAWIKLHKAILDDFEFHCLPLASRALAPMLWLLASESSEGEIECNWKKLAFRLRADAQEIESAVKSLIDGGFFELVQDASEPLAEPEREASLEKRREEDINPEEEGEERGACAPAPAKQAIAYLNAKTGSKFQNTKTNLGHVNARLSEGNSLDDVKAVIDFKAQEWGPDPKMRQYLRPETLFSQSKFPGYLTAARASPQQSRHTGFSERQYTEHTPDWAQET